MKIEILILAFLALSITSCRRNKIQKTIADIKAEKEVVFDSLKSVEVPTKTVQLEIDQCDLSTIKFKSKIDIESPFFNQSFPCNVQLKKDSALWISVAIGLEIGRALISTDSVIVLDRINRKFYSMDFGELSQRLQFDVNFSIIQALVLGNLPYPQQNGDLVSENSLYTSLFQNKERFKIQNQIEKINKKLTTILVDDSTSGNSLGIQYSEFAVVDRELLPATILSKIDNKNKPGEPSTVLNIYHNKIEAGDINLRFPFNIPKSYTKGELNF